jgi:hypothetical protein
MSRRIRSIVVAAAVCASSPILVTLGATDPAVTQQMTIDKDALKALLGGALPLNNSLTLPIPPNKSFSVALQTVTDCAAVGGRKAFRGRSTSATNDRYVKVVAGAGTADIFVLGDDEGWVYSIVNALEGTVVVRSLNSPTATCAVNGEDQSRQKVAPFVVAASGAPSVRQWPAAPRTLRFAVSATNDFQQAFADPARTAAVNVHFASTVFEKFENVALCPIVDQRAFESAANPIYADLVDRDKALKAHDVFKRLELTYDLGQVFDMDGSSWGEPGALCVPTMKGHGITNWSSTVSPGARQENVWVLAHETSHQMGAFHTFNANFSGRVPGSAVEPSEGRSLMGYPPSKTSLWFHPHSVGEILTGVNAAVANNASCGQSSGGLAASSPTMKDNSVSVPHDTPFRVTVAGSGAKSFSIGEVTAPPGATIPPPWFSAQAPSSDPVFTYPAVGDTLPSGAATLKFLTMGRDAAGSIGFGVHEVVVTSDGPFAIGAQTGWHASSAVTLTWHPGGSQNAPLNAGVVDVWISNAPTQPFRKIKTNVANTGVATLSLGTDDHGDHLRVQLTVPGHSFFAVSPEFQVP